MKHHVWCNLQNPHNPTDDAETCSMCLELRKLYPEDGKTGLKLAQAHFPEAIPVSR